MAPGNITSTMGRVAMCKPWQQGTEIMQRERGKHDRCYRWDFIIAKNTSTLHHSSPLAIRYTWR